MRWRFVWLFVALALSPAAARADVRPNALCTEGMVLQQKHKVRLWGDADPGETVTVTFRGKTAQAAANDKGHWLVSIESGSAGGPFEMTIAGKNTLNYKNVLVGEVWICSGQSNMQWTVAVSGKEDVQRAQSAAPNSMLRMFNVERIPSLEPKRDVKGQWTEANPKTVAGFSAVGYFFGRKLQEKLKVPVGMIHTSWGGTRAEAWTRKEILDKHRLFQHEHKNLARAVAAFKEKKGKNPLHANAASALYNGMIAPLLPCTFQGAIWYQGESNAGNAWAYRELFPLMIQNWRADWKQGDFPFYFVQLAPFTAIRKAPGESSWAELREAQLMTLKLPRTGMAVITDLGSEYDIHPTPKSPVGQRLARIALAQVYGEKGLAYSGPTFQSMKTEGNKVILSFDHAEGGLVAKELVPTRARKGRDGQVHAEWRVKEGGSQKVPLIGFTIAGKDRKFHPAQAEIQGTTVVVSCADVPEPVAVRFGWADHPLVNLFNGAGLPASPFRTDTYPGVTAPKQK